jgi:cytidine deaminase
MENQKLTKQQVSELVEYARAAAAQAYAPYSHFAVGAALQTEDGRIFCGVNVENASYGLTICAERNAVAAAIAAGARQFTALALFSPNATASFYPCGACLQVLAEFNDDLAIYTLNPAGKIQKTTLQLLLPSKFRFGNLK